jgi:hypothetical protein
MAPFKREPRIVSIRLRRRHDLQWDTGTAGALGVAVAAVVSRRGPAPNGFFPTDAQD